MLAEAKNEKFMRFDVGDDIDDEEFAGDDAGDLDDMDNGDGIPLR